MSVEAWLRGPVDGIQPLLMPAAHALLQAREDLYQAAGALSAEEVWHRPAGVASIGFHLRHIAGSLDRLLSYARASQLVPGQLAALREEGSPGTPPATAADLLRSVDAAVDVAMTMLAATREEELLEARSVGRAGLPSNVLGLLYHAAEHAQRHTGQVITTARIVHGAARVQATDG